MHLVGCFYETYHDARSLEHKVQWNISFTFKSSGINLYYCGPFDKKMMIDEMWRSLWRSRSV